MPSFRKVLERGEGTADLNADQKKYEQKVGELKKACDKFGGYLKTVKSGTPFADIIKAFENKDKGFGNQLKKNRLFSRTSRILHGMSKNLSKFKKESFDPGKIDNYVGAFWFKAEKPNTKGYIKRSAIDDAQIVKFFTGQGSTSISGILNLGNNNAGSNASGAAASKMDATLKESINEARKSLSQTRQTLATARTAEKSSQTAVETVKGNPSIDQPVKKTAVTRLTSQQSNLKSDMRASQKASEQLASSISSSERILKSPNATAEEKEQEQKNLETAMKANTAQTQELNKEIKGTEAVGNKVAADVANAENKTKSKNSKNIDDFFTALEKIKTEVQQTISSWESAEERNVKMFGLISENYAIDNKTKGDNPNSPNIEQDLNSAKKQADKVNKAIDDMKEKIKTAEETHQKAQTAIAQAGESPFDFKTKTFTVKNEADFEKAEDYKRYISKVVIENGIKKVKTNAFSDFKSLKEVVFSGNSCTNIGRSAFSGCVNLAKIDLGKIQKIGRSAFMGCEALTDIKLNSATEINDDAFLECEKLKSVVLGSNCTVIRNGAFMKCKELETINLGKVQILEDKAFYDCHKLGELDLKSVKEICEETFDWSCVRDDENFELIPGKKIVLPDNAKAREIVSKNIYGEEGEDGIREFHYDQGMCGMSFENGTIVINNNSEFFTKENISKQIEEFKRTRNQDFRYVKTNHLQKIRSNLFKDYKGITKVTLDSTCKIVGDMAFSGCENYKKINLEDVQRIGAESFKNTALKDVNLLSVQKMSSGAFSDCRNLKNVILGIGLTKINKETFSGSSLLEDINLNYVKNIGKKAFYMCTSLKRANLESVETIEQDAFFNCIKLEEVVLPLNNEKAAKIKELILKQVGVGARENIKFINDPIQKEEQKKQ